MCHGLIDKQACKVSTHDLLREVIYQEPDYENYILDVIDFPDGSDCFLPDNTLVGVINDYSAVKKLDSEADTFASTGLLTTWFDCIKDDDDEPVPAKPAHLASRADKVASKSRKARKSAAAKEQSRNSGMEDEDPVLIDEKRKRRMSSNRASAQRSRQKKQERLDELEILTAQLRLEKATLARRARLAEEVAKSFQAERDAMAKKVHELKQELQVARDSQASPDAGDVNSGICNMIEGGLLSRDTAGELDTSCKDHSESVSNTEVKCKNSCAGSIFQGLFDAFSSHQFDVSIGGEVPELPEEEWVGS